MNYSNHVPSKSSSRKVHTAFIVGLQYISIKGVHTPSDVSTKSISIPIGSMYAIYDDIYHQYTPFMLAYIPAPWILWDVIFDSWTSFFPGLIESAGSITPWVTNPHHLPSTWRQLRCAAWAMAELQKAQQRSYLGAQMSTVHSLDTCDSCDISHVLSETYLKPVISHDGSMVYMLT